MQQKRGNITGEMQQLSEKYSGGTEIQAITMYKLLQTYEKVIRKFNERTNKPQHVVVKYNYSLEGQRSFLMTYLQEQRQMPFELLFEKCETRIHAIFTFLAMLELVQQKFISLMMGEGRNNFIIEWNIEPANDDIEPTDAANTIVE
jgi:segregation and condensation protein A